MRRCYLTLLLVFCYAATASAQFTMTADDLRAYFGQTLTSQSFFATNSDGVEALIDKDGANQTWDFTAFTYDTEGEGEVTYLSPPTGIPGASDPVFSQANYAAGIDRPDSTAWVFFRVEDDAHYDLGLIYEDGQEEFRAYYSEPFQSLAFPLTFGTTWDDEADYTFESPSMGAFTTRTTQSGEVDGYGTLITPAGAFECLRMVLVRESTVSGFTTTTTSYSWITREGVTASATRTGVGGFFFYSAGYQVQGEPGGGGGGGTEPPASAPANLSPADGSNDQETTLTFQWDPVTDATTYQLQVASDAAFNMMVFEDATLTATMQDVSGLTAGTTYYWRVRASNSAGDGPFSAVYTFTTVINTAIEAIDDIPAAFQLHGAYPNPFNPRTTIRFDLMQSETVALDVIDATGRLVERLVHTSLPAGTYEIPFDASSLSSGPYLYRLQAGPHTDTRVMMLLK